MINEIACEFMKYLNVRAVYEEWYEEIIQNIIYIIWKFD